MTGGEEQADAGGWWHRYVHHSRHHAAVATFIAGLLLLTDPVWYAVDDSLSIVAEQIAVAVSAGRSEFRPELSNVAIVKISRARYADPAQYKGTSPLDRCKLKRDLETLLQTPGVEMVAIDLDLSPIERDHGATNGCQPQLDKLIDDHARTGNRTLIAMAPAASDHPETNDKIEHWRRDREAAGVKFGDVSVNVSHGLVKTRSSPTGIPAFSGLIQQGINSQPAVAPPPERVPFRALPSFFADGRDVPLDDKCLGQGSTRCGIRGIIFGAGYSSDDEFVSPIGLLHGVDVHAALAACPPHGPWYEVLHHAAVFLAEVSVSSLLLGHILHFFWLRYFETRAGARWLSARSEVSWWSVAASRWIPRHPEAAWIWLVYLTGASALIVLGLQVMIESASPDPCKAFIPIAPLVLGLAAEAGIMQSVSVANRLRGSKVPAERWHPARTCRTYTWWLVLALTVLQICHPLMSH